MYDSNKKVSTQIIKYLNFGEAIIAIGACFIGLFYIFVSIGNSITMLAIGVILLVVGVFSFKFRKKITLKLLGKNVEKEDV